MVTPEGGKYGFPETGRSGFELAGAAGDFAKADAELSGNGALGESFGK
jgi:hypothetical protein